MRRCRAFRLVCVCVLVGVPLFTIYINRKLSWNDQATENHKHALAALAAVRDPVERKFLSSLFGALESMEKCANVSSRLHHIQELAMDQFNRHRFRSHPRTVRRPDNANGDVSSRVDGRDVGGGRQKIFTRGVEAAVRVVMNATQDGGLTARRLRISVHGHLKSDAPLAREEAGHGRRHLTGNLLGKVVRQADEDGIVSPMEEVSDRPTVPRFAESGRNANFKRQRWHLPSHVVRNVRQLVLFIGYPRSCHSLVASLMDAHPSMVIANEFNLVGKWKELPKSQQTRQVIFELLYNETRRQAKFGYLRGTVPGTEQARLNSFYAYGVPNEWQGNYDNSIYFIGDKHGGRTAKLVNGVGHSGVDFSIFDEISRVLEIPLIFIHVMRHPLDNVATMALWNQNLRHVVAGRIFQEKVIVDRDRLAGMTNVYSNLVSAVAKVKSRYRTIDLRCEDMVANPVKALGNLCSSLDLRCSKRYLQDCATIVSAKRSKTRTLVTWYPDILEEFVNNITQFSFIPDNYKLP